jgi:hypothetical protein
MSARFCDEPSFYEAWQYGVRFGGHRWFADGQTSRQSAISKCRPRGRASPEASRNTTHRPLAERLANTLVLSPLNLPPRNPPAGERPRGGWRYGRGTALIHLMNHQYLRNTFTTY